MGSLRVVLVSVAWLGSALGQISFSPGGTPASTAKHEVTGVVVNASTGEPLRKALVSLQTGEGQNAALSDAAGHFTLENVPEGTYGLQCQKPGYFALGAGAPFQQVRISATPEAITIKMIAAAAVTGRVNDEQGQPVEGAPVQLFTQMIMNGRKRWTPGQAATTDEDGNYELDNLQPGTYRLRMNMHSSMVFAPTSQTPRSRLPLQVYPTQYFPQGSDPSGAQSLVLQGGQTEHADFTATAVAGFRVRGTVAPFKPGTFIRMEDASGNDVGVNASVNGNGGRFIIPGISAGAWRVVGQSFGSEEQLWGEQRVDVNGADVTNVALHLEAVPNIPVEIVNGPEGGTQPLMLRLVRDDEMDGSGWRNDFVASTANAPEDGQKAPALRFVNVLPGHYALRAQTYGAHTCLDSVRAGNTDVARDGITVAPGQSAQPIQVSLRTDCASIDVKLNLPEGVALASVLILSDNPTFERPLMTASAAATIQFVNLSPGRYRLFAFTNAEKLEYANPEVLSKLEGKEIVLDANQKADITLDVVKRTPEAGAGDGAH